MAVAGGMAMIGSSEMGCTGGRNGGRSGKVLVVMGADRNCSGKVLVVESSGWMGGRGWRDPPRSN